MDNFLRDPILLSTVAGLICPPTSKECGLLSPSDATNIGCVLHDDSHSGVRWKATNIDHFLQVFTGHLSIFMWKVSVQFQWPVMDDTVDSLVDVLSSLHRLDIKLKIELPYDLAIHSGYISERTKVSLPQRHLYTYGYYVTIDNSHIMETAEVSINRWMECGI
jgi:hypothetical protein